MKKDCYWYRPWRDMGATFDQCELAETAECPCKENCEHYITQKEADAIIKQTIGKL